MTVRPCYSADIASAHISTAWSRAPAPGTARCSSFEARPGSARQRCSTTSKTNAAGCRIAWSAGAEAEMELAYAGLHQICGPFLDRLDRLPDPQRIALSTAFGLIGGDAPDRFMVGLAVLDLLADRAEERPLICLIDDAQWLDRVSAQTLAFVARRLVVERIAVVAAIREPSDERDFVGLPELTIDGLREADAGRLLDSVVKGPMDPRVRDRIIAETRGNPLALLELPRAWTTAELADG